MFSNTSSDIISLLMSNARLMARKLKRKLKYSKLPVRAYLLHAIMPTVLLKFFRIGAKENFPQDTQRRRALLEKNRGRVCIVPFVRFDVWADGRVPVCCTDWMQGDVIIGNVFKQDFHDVWNSKTAKRIRKSVTDGTFSHCTEKCPLLAEARLPLREELGEEQRAMIDNPEVDLDHPPEFIKLVNDDSCNLSCPSCRHEVFIASHSKSEEIFEANMRAPDYPQLPTHC